MLTAAEARELRPRTELIDSIKDDIERAIRNVAIAGRRDAEVSALVPNFIAWASEKSANPGLDQLKADLLEGGYKVDIHAGGGNLGRPYFRISWKD